MSAKDYDLLKKKSAAADLSANAWLMAQLAANRPVLYREAETWGAIHFMDAAGREINAIARDFNSGAAPPRCSSSGRCVRTSPYAEEERIPSCCIIEKRGKFVVPYGITAGISPSA